MSHHHAYPAHKRSDSVHEHPMSGPPRKRVTLACNACRTKRIKCDGDETSCSACSQRGEHCQYDSAGSKRTRVSNAYIHALEARVQALETALNLRDEKTMRLTRMIGSQGFGRTAVSHAPMSATEGQTDVDSLADALGCFTVGDTGELRFFGTSSNFSIIRHHTLRVASSTDARRAGIEAAHKMTDFIQPSNETRDHLLELYWKWQNSWQYIVARESFVEDLYVTKSAKYCTPLLLYAMLALSCRFSDREELRTDPEDANTAGEAFATQARLMLHYECEAPTTSTVQAAAILGLYSAAIDREGHGFMYIGMASRMAMNLGLHSDCSAYVEKGLISREDAEARKIAFWGVYVLDKLYCVGMGRPAGILEWNITTMKPAAEDRPTPMLSAQQSMISHPWQTSLITENAMQMCSIFIITSAVIDQLYAQKPEWSEIEKYERIMDTHLNLVKWHEALPKRLRISDSSDKPAPPFVYQMHLQHHVSLILLHRPYFRVLYNGPSSGIYDPSCEDIHSKTCHEAAVKISNILRIFRHNYTNRCSPVSAVHPALTAGIIHLLELTTADPAGQSRAARHLKICLSSLYEMNLNWAWASRSIRALQSLAVEWGVGDWLPTLLGGIPEDNLAHFAEYERSCVEVATMPLAEIFHPQQQAWPQDTFDVWQHGPLDDNILDILGSDWCEPAA